MIAKQIKGKGFRGAAEYDLGKGQNAQMVASNMAGETPRQLSREFGAVRQLRPTLGKAVAHVSLSAAPGEQLTTEQWQQVADDYLKGMGFDDSQYIVTRHTDTAHDHVHILANRVTLDGGVVSDSQDYRRQESLMRELEQRHGLTPVRSSAEAERKPLTQPEIEKAIRTSEEPPRQALQRLVSEAASDAPSASVFAERLHDAGVEVRPNIASTGRLSGFSFGYDGVTFSGSKLGRSFTWKNLQAQHGVHYEQERDRQSLEQLAASPRAAPSDADDAGAPAQSGRAVGAADERHVSADRDDQQRGDADRRSQDPEPAGGQAPAAAPAQRADAPEAPATGTTETTEPDSGADPESEPAAAEAALVDNGSSGDWSIDRITDHLRYHLAADVTPAQPGPMPEPTEPEPGPTRAERTITQAVNESPAPEHEGSVWGVQRLKLWYQSLRRRLAGAIEHAREHWRSESTASAEAAGWTEDERERAGVEPPATAELGRETDPKPAPQAESEPESVTDIAVPGSGEHEQARQAFQEERGEPVLTREIVQTEDGRWEFSPLTVDDEWPQEALNEWDQRQEEIDQGPRGPSLG